MIDAYLTFADITGHLIGPAMLAGAIAGAIHAIRADR